MRNHFGKQPAVATTETSDSELARKWRLQDHQETDLQIGSSEYYDDDYYKKSSRSCKGKRYQEIMKSISKNGSPNKRLKVKHTSGSGSPTTHYQSSSLENGFRHFDVGAVGMEVDVKDVNLEDQKDIDRKMFDATDFDLEEKIKALPALSLDEYLARKRETKKTKKKLGGRFFDFVKNNYE